MSEGGDSRRPSEHRRRWPRLLAATVLMIAVFAVGIALGQALNDGPPTPSTETYVRTLESRTQDAGTTGP